MRPLAGNDVLPADNGVSIPEPRRDSTARLMPESEAFDLLLPIASPFYRGTPQNCVRFRALGYFNDGYTIDVRDNCANQPLGRWRVDARTREVLRLDSDGTYRKP